MDLANIRQNGVRSLDVICYGCRPQVVINVEKLPGEPKLRWFGRRVVCTKCGTIEADARPNWRERQR
jgi:hypothetical protein